MAEARRVYAATLAEKTAAHDAAIVWGSSSVAQENAFYKAAQAERERVRENAKDAAQWAYERRVADAWRDERAIDDNHESFWPRVDSESAAAGHVQTLADAQTEHDYAIGLATDQRDWVAAVGLIHVALATDAKAAADTLAASLKTASDGLTSDQAEAAKGLATDLATAEADYTSGNATLQASHDNAAAVPDGQLEIDLTSVANLQREGLTRERNEYETDSYGRHSTAISALGSTSLVAPGGLSGALGDLVGYQRGVAAQDLAWSTGKGTAQNNFESLLSSAYLAHATAEHGPLGSVPTRIQAAGAANVSRITGLANSDKTLSIDSTGNLADFTEAAQSAASKAAKDGVAAETEYDVGRATAKAAYHNAIAAAELARTIATQDAYLTYTLAVPYPLPAGWDCATECQSLQATRDAALTAATATYDAAVKQAQIDHATTVGDGQILRAQKLGDALVTEATESGDAEIGFVTAQNGTEATFETDVSLKEITGTTSIVAGDGVYSNAHQTNERNLIVGIGAAAVALATEMKPVNVNLVSGKIAAEGTYYAADKSRIASRHTTYAAAFGPTTRQAFEAAQANAESQWLGTMVGPYSAYAGALVTADQGETIALTEARVAYETARADADVIEVAARQPLNATRAVGSTTAWRGFAEEDAARLGTRNSTLAASNKTFDVADSTGIRTQAIAYATANKEYWVAFLERGPLVVEPPELPPAIDPLELERKVALAHADLVYVQTYGNSEVDWTADVAAAERIYVSSSATGIKSLEAQTALLQKDQIVAYGGLAETRQLAYVTAETNLWLAETTAANNRRAAEDLALANFRDADYAAKATAIGSIDTAMDLPWTEYLAGRAAAENTWWIEDERANFLALSAAKNAADLTYETTVDAAYTTWATQTLAAERAYEAAQAEQSRAETVGRAAADEVYATTVAAAEETWQNALTLNLKNRRNEYWTDRRDAIAENDTTFVELWELIVLMPMPGDAEADRAFDVAVFLADGQRTVSEIVARRDKVTGTHPAETAYFTATADADQAYTLAESSAAATRGAAIAAAISNHDIVETDSLAEAIEALTLASPSPWSNYDAADAAASAAFTAAVAAAASDAVIAELNAERDYAQSMAGHERTAILSLVSSKQAHEAAVLNGAVTRAQSQLTLQTTAAANPTVPVGALGAVEQVAFGAEQPKGGAAQPPAAPADPNTPQRAETFEDIYHKLEKKWNKDKKTLLREFVGGVKEGFIAGFKDTVGLVKGSIVYGFAGAEYLYYTASLTGIAQRELMISWGWGDPIAEQEAFLRTFSTQLVSYSVSAVAEGSDLWERREELTANFALQAVSIASRVQVIRKQAGQFLDAHGEELISAILAGDMEKLEQLKKGLPPELREVIDVVYAGAVSIADAAADQLDAHKIGYLVGQLLYEACEDAVISAAWAAFTTGTAGTGGATAPGVIAARLANLSRRLNNAAKYLKIDAGLIKTLEERVQSAVWWVIKHMDELCFVAGTLVHAAHGLRPIDEIQVGELVYSRPDRNATEAPRLKRVLKTVVTRPTRLYHVTVQSADHREETISGTGEHPFYVTAKQRFVPAKELEIGDELLLADGSSAWVTRIAIEDAPSGDSFTTYNFTVEDDHTYHVGELGIWVHNEGKFCGDLLKAIQKMTFKNDSQLRAHILDQVRKHGGTHHEQLTHLQQVIDGLNDLRKHDGKGLPPLDIADFAYTAAAKKLKDK